MEEIKILLAIIGASYFMCLVLTCICNVCDELRSDKHDNEIGYVEINDERYEHDLITLGMTIAKLCILDLPAFVMTRPIVNILQRNKR